MRRILSVTLTLIACFVVLGVPPAGAGGPTSVLLVNYGTGRAAAALNNTPTYNTLESILGNQTQLGARRSQPEFLNDGDPSVRIVWLIHDIEAWRTDDVRLAGSEVWVATWLDPTGAAPGAGTWTWHQPARGAELVASLTALGLLGPGTGEADEAAATHGALAPAPAGTAASDSWASSPVSSGSVSSGVRWPLAAGLACLGLLVGALGGTLLARGRHTPPSARAPA
ncbi:MAG TPA: hypothetical protein PLK69_10675 [Tetrasphaera sp.]|nr:hypothetical protein [Tetrasphaera sp.]